MLPLFVDQFEGEGKSEGAAFRPKWKGSSLEKQIEGGSPQRYSRGWAVDGVASRFVADPSDHGLLLAQPNQYYAISASLEHPVSLDGKRPFMLQYEVKHDKEIACSGSYLKLLTGYSGPRDFQEGTGYSIMFGPDRCGPEKNQVCDSLCSIITKANRWCAGKVLFSFAHRNPANGQVSIKHLKNPPKAPNTQLTTLYTLVVNEDNTFEILVNRESVRKGSLLEDFEPPVNPPKMIPDPADQRPAWWDDNE